MKAFTFVFYTAVTAPLVGFLVYPSDPLRAFDDMVGATAILAVSAYAGLVALIGVWLSTKKRWEILRGGSSIGVFVGLSLFPLFFLVLFFGGPITLAYTALSGKVHGIALKGIYGIDLKA